MKLGLGTAQFGMDYGISNTAGKVGRAGVKDILDLALRLGVSVIDTAPGYGDSESAVGQALARGHPFRIVTKTPVFKEKRLNARHAADLVRSFERSLESLAQTEIYGLLVHHADNVLAEGGRHLLDAMTALRASGRVEKIGVSVYTAGEIDNILELFTPDIVQLPLSVLDQRLLRSGHLRKLHGLGVEIHARSIFLQGLLLMKPRELPVYFEPVRPHLSRYFDFLAEHRLQAIEAPISFVGQLEEIQTMILGVCSTGQLAQLGAATARIPAGLPDMSGFALADPDYVNPALWRLNAS